MTEAHPCLLSVGKTSSKYRHFPFLEDQVKIGRAADVTYTILSATISRCHAIISKQQDNTWTIVDNKSLNGISVNGKKLQVSEPYTLQDGDIVQLGVPSCSDVPAEFVYRFFSSLKVRKEKSGTKRSSSQDDSQSKRHKATESQQSVELGADQTYDRSEKENKHETQEEKKLQEHLKSEYEEKLRAMAQELKEKEDEKSAIAQQLQQEREERQVMEEKHKQQEERVMELDTKQKQLAEEKAAAEEAMQRQLEEQLREREELLRSQMAQQLEQLSSEKSQVEERLHREMEKAVQEKDRELQDRLQGEKDRLQKIIENKELEQKALESELVQSREENEKALADSTSAREALLSEFAETMETELQCAICNELFVKATSLNCSHAFCSLCLRQWLAVKKECPNCRASVTSQMRSIVLDNYIDRMVEQLSAEMKQRRTELVAERKEAEKKLDEAEKVKATAGPSGAALATLNRPRGRGRQRGRGRGGRGGRGRGGGGAVSAIVTPTPVAATAPATAAVPAVGATITIGSETDELDAPAIAVPAGEAIVVSDAESDSDSNSGSGSNEGSLDDIDRFYRGFDSEEDYGSVRSNSDRNSDEDSDNSEADYVRGTGAYFGGYGRCFKCGMRGHWANGCPFS